MIVMKTGRRCPCWRLAGVGLLLIHMLLSLAAGADDWSFTSQQYTGTIKECSVACDKLYVTTPERMGIRLPSLQKVDQIRYRITKPTRNSDSTNQFKAELLLVGDFAFLFIRTKTDGSTNLNREWKSYYSLNVRGVITFKDGEIIDTNTRVDVTILDVNDAPPLFTQLKYAFDVPESADLFSTVGSVKATDADEGFNAEIYYSFEQWLPEFAVHPTKGDVYITRNISSSGKRHYSNYIVASNRGAGRHTKAEITFNIIQRNDNSPQFIVSDRPPINAFEPIGIAIMLIKVLDIDSGLNGDIQSVEIISAVSSLVRDARLYFTLQPTSLSQPHAAEFQLQVARSLKDIGNQVNVTIQAWDKGSPVRSAITTVTLSVMTSNKELNEEETVHLEIDEGLPAGTPLHYIAPPRYAIDATYRIVSDDLDSFRVHSTSGVLFLKKKIDAEKNYQTHLEVRLIAKLSVLERFQYVVKFIVTIRDENDNSPVFANPIEKPLAEDSPIGTLVTIASATDNDAAENSLITYSIANKDQLPFEIDSFSGEIRLSDTVDYDVGRKLYHIPVRASDRGSPYRRETEKIFTVVMQNVNDNKPMFEFDQCEVEIAKDIPEGATVSTVAALDLDMHLNKMTYSIRSEGSAELLLTVEPSSGVITTTKELHYLLGRSYHYSVSAFDGLNYGTPMVLRVKVVDYVTDNVKVICTETQAKRIYQEAIRLSAQINPSRETIMLPSSTDNLANIHSPVFTNEFITSSTQYSLPEDLPVGSIITHITATDDDSGFAGLIQYNILEGNSLGHFAINGSTGALIVFAPLDRETIPKYNLTVVATDGAGRNKKSATMSIRLTVLDANDNSPRFLSGSFYEAYISETANRGTTVLQVMARDDDIENNGKVQYSLITETPYFAIDDTSGRIIVRGELDRESKDRHMLEVKASDMPVGLEEVRFATTTVIIHVTDVNDNAPEFMRSEFKVKVREDMPVGTVITNLVAQDADLPASGGEVNYRIIKGRRHGHTSQQTGVEDVFHIDKYTGIVKLLKKLDYEMKTLYRITVRARDNGTEQLKSNCELLVEVIDVNENVNRPTFERLAYEQVVAESTPPGHTVLQVKATDSDVAVSDHRLTYSIRRGSGLGSFTIDDEGYIKTTISLDRETRSSYWLTVYAQDYGSVPLSSSVDVYIEVKDVNDNAPEASQPVYYVSVRENSPSNLRIATIVATDRDNASDMSYSITGGNTQSLFSIESKTGIIRTTRRTLDRESDEMHTLEVTVSDGGSPVALSSSVQVWITITDENDNPPTWNIQGKLSVPILRSHDRTKPVYRVVASDLDKGENGSISYSIQQNSDKTLWRIDSLTGELYMKSDWPTTDEISVKIKATDAGFEPQSVSLDVNFEVIEAVSVASRFTPVLKSMEPVYMLETVRVFEFVGIAQAIDSDSSNIWYSIVDGAHSGSFPMFSIQPLVGLVEVAGNLDFETKSEYTLNISATDGHNTGYGTLRIILSNVNEFQPQFKPRVYEMTVKENVTIGSEIVQLTATDDDADDVLIYLIHSASNNDSYKLFGVDHATGIISTLLPLDHESNHRHELIVKVNDNGFKEYSDYAKVIVHVEDDNDHVPLFVTDTLSVRVYERSVIGTSVTQVQATDKDKGDNSRIQYSLQSGNVGYTFNVDANLGIISLARTLDLEVRSQYELTIMANDMGNPSLSSTCLVKVYVTVADERPPSFASTFFTAELRENEPIGTFVTALSGESQSALTYEIINKDKSGMFSINPNSGILTSNTVFDFEKRSMYNVTIRATDIVGHQVLLSVAVHILDSNDNRPSFTKMVYRGHVSEGAQDGFVILTNDSVPLILTAEDKDSNLNALLLYSIVGSEASKYFTVDRNTGAIRTVVTPDREIKSVFEFSVQVRDQALDALFLNAPWLGLHSGEESLSAANPARVIITIDDINDTPPTFSQTNYQTTLLTPTYEGVIVHAVSAIDNDLNSELQYEIVNGNADNKFAIEEKTGVVYVSNPTLFHSSYSLVVKVSDGVHDAVYSLVVSVVETSGSGLTFTESQYSGEVIENRTSSQTILIVLVLNQMLGEPVTFQLLNYRDVFKIGYTSGVLESKAGAVIDREIRQKYEVIIRVASIGSDNRLAQVPVIVNVKDVNDNAPYFTRDHYYASTTVTTVRQAGVIQVKAFDDDKGENSEVRYDITSNENNDFRINRKTGNITVKRSLVDKANKEYTFNVTATDQGEPMMSAQATVTIKVYAESTPNFTNAVYESSIPENIPISSAVTTVNADSPHGNKIIYTISEGDSNNEFTVHFSTAMDYNSPCTIRVNDDLDFELRQQYRLKIRAVDVVTGDWSDAIVIINVQDVNDQTPYFSQLDYYKTVSEAITVGSKVITLNASDSDQGINSLVHYSLKPVDENTPHHHMFEIKENREGAAEIRTVSPLDHEKNTRLDFIIVATDGGNPRRSSEAYVHIQLKDLNDNAPVFEQPTYSVEISDEVKKSQFVAMVGATDADVTNEGELMYNIVRGNEGQAFTINQNSGSVYVSPFHQSSMFTDVYALNISVSDGIYTSFTSLTVTVKPANRHSPQFESILYNFKVFENSTEGRVLGQVRATDEDKGQYGEITYSLVGDWLQEHFRIHPTTANVTIW